MEAVRRTLEALDGQLDELDGADFDVAELILRFTMDLLGTSMLDVDFRALVGPGPEGPSVGRQLLENFECSIKEFALKAPFQPHRAYLTWALPERQRAVKARDETRLIAQVRERA